MKKILLGIAISVLILPFAYCQEPPLSLTIKSDKRSYNLSEPIIIEAALKNMSLKDVMINTQWFPAFNINFTVTCGSEKLEQHPIQYKLPLPQKEHFRELKPGKQHSERFDMSDYVTIDKGGQYNIQITYKNWIDSYCYRRADGMIDGNKHVPVEVWIGTLTSNPITIEVKEKKQPLQRFDESSPLTLTIKSDKQVYEAGEEIKLEATINNNSDKEMIIFWSDQKPGTCASGRSINLVFSDNSESDAIYIKPTTTFTKSISFDNDLVPWPGQWVITILLNNQNVLLGFLVKLNQEIFLDTLTSNPITIEVKEGALSVKKECEDLVLWYQKKFETSADYATGTRLAQEFDKRANGIIKKYGREVVAKTLVDYAQNNDRLQFPVRETIIYKFSSREEYEKFKPQQRAAQSLSKRLSVTEGEKLIHGKILAETPDMNPAFRVSLKELTTEEIWKRLGIQIFKAAFFSGKERFRSEYYLIKDRKFIKTGESFGGFGIMSMCVSDLGRDGQPELLYTYSFGSGIHRSRVALYTIHNGTPRIIEWDSAYSQGDLFLKKIDDQDVIVEIGEYDYQKESYTPVVLFGKIFLEYVNGEAKLSVGLDKQLPEKERKKIHND